MTDHRVATSRLIKDCCSPGMRVGARQGGVSESWWRMRYRARRILHCIRIMRLLWHSFRVALPHPNSEEASRYVDSVSVPYFADGASQPFPSANGGYTLDWTFRPYGPCKSRHIISLPSHLNGLCRHLDMLLCLCADNARRPGRCKKARVPQERVANDARWASQGPALRQVTPRMGPARCQL